ncbi:MAG: hypothetical protein JNK78_04305 [Planctomycetes bacterium]|nr:hypothetical protein [Planctomycetota bacterium]
MPRVVATAATRLLADPDPRVRGEAAIVVAQMGDAANHGTIVTIAKDRDPAARQRGLVALGLQATAGIGTVLDDQLADLSARSEPESIAAAFALGLLPPDHSPTTTSRVLTSFLHGNLRRQRDALLALLLGMGSHPQTAQAAALRQLLNDDSLRDPVVRAEALKLLLPVDRTFDEQKARRMLERGSREERIALLAWLGDDSGPLAAALVGLLQHLAEQGEHADERARALAVLSRLHHLPALEIAARALRSTNPDECRQAMRAVLTIGGAPMRGALDQRVVDETDADRKAAMLESFDAPPSASLLAQAARLAGDTRQPELLRVAATRMLARSEPERARPLLRDLFRTVRREDALPGLATDMLRGDDAPPLARLFEGTPDARLEPARWCALLGAEHPVAIRDLLQRLSDPAGDAAGRGAALAAWRRARVLHVPRPVGGQAPAVLVALLGS